MSIRLRSVVDPSKQLDLEIAPHATYVLNDPLTTLHGATPADGVDALLIESPYRWGAQLVARARISAPSLFEGEGGGRYGYSVPAVPMPAGYSTHLNSFAKFRDTPETMSQFLLDQRGGAREHTIGIVNDSSSPMRVDLKYGHHIVTEDTTVDREITVAPHSVGRVVVEDLFDVALRFDKRAAVWIAAERPAPVFLLARDRMTNDTFLVPYAQFDIQPASTDRSALPWAEGGETNAWRTELYGSFLIPPSPAARPSNEFDANVYERDTPCGVANRAGSLRAIAGIPAFPDENFVRSFAKHIFPDIAQQLFPCNGAFTGAVEVNTTSWMSGFARTYRSHSRVGTYGDTFSFYPQNGWPVQHITGLALDPNSSIRIGLYNGDESETRYELILYDAEGKATEREMTLPSKDGRIVPLSEIFGSVPESSYGLTVIAPGDKGSWAYVLVEDRITGDVTILM